MIVDMEAPALSEGKVKARGLHRILKNARKIQATPALGQHTQDILKNTMGYDDKKISDLQAKGVLG